MPQLHLTRHEIARLPMGNQYTRWNVIRWQVVKGAAAEAGVSDWTARVDSSLTYRENVELMQRLSVRDGPTLRELTPELLAAGH